MDKKATKVDADMEEGLGFSHNSGGIEMGLLSKQVDRESQGGQN